MPLRAVRSPSSLSLWTAFVEGFLADVDGHTGPGGYPAFAWLTHRIQRDRLYAAAAARGVPGWLAPPVAFWSALPRLFPLDREPLDVLGREILLDTLIAERPFGPDGGTSRLDRMGVEYAADRAIGELLAEGVTPAALEAALGVAAEDEFASARNRWIADLYHAYSARMDATGHYDPRAIHALVAERIAQGQLPEAIRGAHRLHLYGLWTTRARGRLLASLRDQHDVDVVVYLLRRDDADEWDRLQLPTENVPAGSESTIEVQPTPDARRELEFVAREVKRLVVEHAVPPHEIAVVARTGRLDARDAHDRLAAVGVPVTARLRSVLAEVPALKAVLTLLRGAAEGWHYRVLRQTLESSYFDIDVDLRSVEWIARRWRVQSLGKWSGALCELRNRIAEGDEAKQRTREGLFLDRLARDCDALDDFADEVGALEGDRSVQDWIRVTRELLDPGWFGFRARLCRSDGEQWATTRLDQQAVTYLDGMLRAWEDTGHGPASLGPADWYRRLMRLLSASEIAVSTPLQRGVQVLEAHEAALMPFTHSFVIHANDGEFPRRAQRGMLFTDDERGALAETGLPIATREVDDRRERALWHGVTAGPAITVSYRTADPNGVPLLPSLLVPDHPDDSAIPRTQFVWDEPVSGVQGARTAMRALATSKREGSADVIATPRLAEARQAVLAAHAEAQRGASRDGSRAPGSPGPWNGSVRDPVVAGRLCERFGPSHVWSASRLEKYAQNPFLFFVENVLYLEELAEAEEATTPLERGSVAHEVLECFHREYDGAYPTELTGDAQELFDRVAREVFERVEADQNRWLGTPALWAATREELHEALACYLRWELPRLTGRVPLLQELAFGMRGDPPFVLRGTDLNGVEVEMQLRGKVDRVDRTADGRLYVVDYKSKSTPSKRYYDDGAALQGPLYMEAVADRVNGTVVEAGYLSLKNTITKKSYLAEARVRRESPTHRRAVQIALTIPGRVCAGRFEPRAAASLGSWPGYWLGADVCRVVSLFGEGESRFDG